MNKARITYRFDQEKDKFDRLSAHKETDKQGTSPGGAGAGHHLPHYEEHVNGANTGDHEIYDSQMLNQFTTDYGAWSSPFDIETERLERLIRESGEDADDDAEERRETYRTELDDGFSRWTDERDERRSASAANGPIIEVDDEQDREVLFDDNLRSPAYSAVSYRSGGASWFRIIASIAGAIATGVLFGLFIMQMFTNLALTPDAPPVTTSQDQENDAVLPPADDTASEGSPDAIAVNVPQHTVYMLQFGVFSSAEGAEAAQNQLRQAGIASAYEAGEQHVVYAGLTPERNSALLLSNQLEQMDLETYVKPYERPAVSNLQWGGAESSLVESYITDGAELARTVSLLTLVHLEETQLTNFEDTTIQALTSSHQQWTTAANQISGDIPVAGETIFEQMNNHLTTAVNSLLEYRKNPSTAYLWQAQTAVMNYFILEKKLLLTLAA